MADLRIPAASVPCAAAGRERSGARYRLDEEECREAIAEDEANLGRPMSPREHEAFARGFLGADDSRDDINRLAEPGEAEGET